MTPNELAYAQYLADLLAVVQRAPAFVIDDNGHPMVAAQLDIEAGYWSEAQIIYRTDGAGIAPVLDCDHGPAPWVE